MKDTFLTQSYKHGHIHTCYNRETQREEVTVQLPGQKVRSVPTYKGAQRIITRHATASLNPSVRS